MLSAARERWDETLLLHRERPEGSGFLSRNLCSGFFSKGRWERLLRLQAAVLELMAQR